MESRERYFIGNPQVDFIFNQIADRLDILEGLRPNLAEGLYKLLTSKEITTTSDTTFIFDNAGLHINDIDGSHYLTISPSSNFTANRILTIVTGDSSRTLTIGGSPTLGDWFDQSVKTTASPTHVKMTLSQAIGTAPLVVTSTTMVSNLNADLLDGSHASAFEVAGAVAAHAPLITGVHGLVFTAGKTLTLTESLTLNAGAAFKLPVFTAANTLGQLTNVGATGEYLAGATGAIPAWTTLNQAAVAGLTDASSPAFVAISLAGSTPNALYTVNINKAITDPPTGMIDVHVLRYLTYTGAESVNEFFIGFTSEIYPIINTGHTNSGTLRAFSGTVARNLNAADSDDSGTLAGMRGLSFAYGHYDTNAGADPKTTNAYGIIITPYAKSGTITNMYDILLDTLQTGGTATNRWGIYQRNTANNYFAGKIGIGVTVSLSKLGVVGNASIGATYGALAAPTSGLIIEGDVGVGTALVGAGVTYQKLSINGSQLFVGADTTQESPMFQVVPSYVVNTHASYTSRTILSQWAIAGAQEVVRFESGASAMIGFLGHVVQALPAAYTQTYATASRTHSNLTAGSVATTGSTTTLPYGYTSSAQADAIPVAINALLVDVANVKQVLNQLIDDIQGYGLVQ